MPEAGKPEGGRAPEAAAEDAPSRAKGLFRSGPVRRFLSTHEVHILPAAVSHRRRVRRVAPVLAVAFLVFAAWWWVVPREDVVVHAQYHEGLFNTIAVDLKVVNSGTLELEPLHIELVVTESQNHTAMGFLNVTASLGPHRTFNPDAVQFKGDQLTTDYNISITVSYTAGASHTLKTLDFRTEEPYMNLYFEGRVA